MRVGSCRGIGALGLLSLLGVVGIFLVTWTDRGRAQDAGAVALWQKLRKLQTTASLLHTTAHPDDEQGGMLAMVSRGLGARTTLLTLTRGESGDNAIGSELFDALGLIRTEELRLADRYYGVDEQYFGTVVDYGFSKRLDEAFEKWGHDAALADVVRVIRIERPFVIVSRFQGTARDGHGNHLAAGVLTQEAFRAAADPKRFPEQIAEGLRPWQAFKLYMVARADDPWTLTIDPGRYDPALGQSYQNLARLGLGFQRSQNGGRVALQPGSAPAYFTRLDTKDAAKESSFFDGLDTTFAALPRLLHRAAPTPPSANRESGAAVPATPEPIAPQVQTLLETIDSEVAKAVAAFSMSDPAAVVSPLTRGLTATRTAIARLGPIDPEIAHVLTLKERQFCDAIVTALGIDLAAIAVPAATSNGPGAGTAAAPASPSPFAPPPTLGPLVAGETFGVQASFVIRGTNATPVGLRTLDVIAPAGWTSKAANPAPASKPIENRAVMQRFEVTVPADAPPTRPPVSRDAITSFRYTPTSQTPSASPGERHRPSAPPLLRLRAEIDVDGVTVDTDTIVTRRENRSPYGDVSRELTVVPAIAIGLSPAQAIVPVSGSRKPIDLAIDLINNDTHETRGNVALKLPAGWHAEPASRQFTLAAGQRARLSASITVPAAAVKPGAYAIEAVATAGSRTFSDGYDTLDHRDLETRYLYRPAATRVRALDVAIAPNLTVGYVMGIGDEVPAAIAQLGATVQLLDEKALTTAPLANFSAIVTGTRAYAVRPDLIAANTRLLDYAKHGGNLIVLYNTPELDPAKYAPFPGTLPQDAEEVSEEDAVVAILAPISPVLSRPNKITADDFNNWVEQRGSKFWKTWDSAYTALLESHDRDQPPQRGGWLYVRYGSGHYSYVAYALHRQLPYGVPGAYRLLANLLSLGR
jgi:LmbE family N-acetylglucosaminyl deacetylase